MMMTFQGARAALITRVNSLISKSDVKIEGPHRGWDLMEVEENQWYLAPSFHLLPIRVPEILHQRFVYLGFQSFAVIKSLCGNASTFRRHYTCRHLRKYRRDGKPEKQVPAST